MASDNDLLSVLKGLLTSSPIDDLKDKDWKRKAVGGAKIAGLPAFPIALNTALASAPALLSGGAIGTSMAPVASGVMLNKIVDQVKKGYPKQYPTSDENSNPIKLF